MTEQGTDLHPGLGCSLSCFTKFGLIWLLAHWILPSHPLVGIYNTGKLREG